MSSHVVSVQNLTGSNVAVVTSHVPGDNTRVQFLGTLPNSKSSTQKPSVVLVIPYKTCGFSLSNTTTTFTLNAEGTDIVLDGLRKLVEVAKELGVSLDVSRKIVLLNAYIERREIVVSVGNVDLEAAEGDVTATAQFARVKLSGLLLNSLVDQLVK